MLSGIERSGLIAHSINGNDCVTLAPIPFMASLPTQCVARRVARCMLALWLVAIGVGVANACAVGAPESGHAPWHASAPETPDAVAAVASDDCDPSDPTRAACRRFCETEQAPAAKVDPLTAVGVAALVPPPGTAVARPDRFDTRPLGAAPIGRRPRPAAFVRFLRLTL